MQNDEREERLERDESAAGEPPEEAPREEPRWQEPETESEPAPDAAADDEAESDLAEAEQFETPSWPQRDVIGSRGDETEVAPTPEAMRVDAQAELEPPPPDAEAYAPPPDATEPVAPAVAAHSVPATEPGESTRCPRCGTENRPGIAFCRNCGQRLVAAGAPTTVARPAPPEGTQACPRCGTHNRAGVAFCQNCGANLRAAAEGYVPPAVAAEEQVVAAPAEAGRAFLGPAVLLIAAIFMGVAWALPFAIGNGSLYESAFGSGGYGIAFWNGYEGLSDLADQAYFGFAAPAPLLILLLVALAVAGVVRRVPGPLQLIGLVLALVWSIGLAVLFVVVEVLGVGSGDLLDILRDLSPGGIIFMLASLIAVIGALTRFGRG